MADEALDAAAADLVAHLTRLGPDVRVASRRLDPGLAPLALPTHFTLAGDEVVLHLARPNPVWAHLEAASEVRLAVIGDYAYIPSYWRARAGGPDEDGVPTSYYSAVQFVCSPTVVDDPQGKVEILEPSSAISSPRATTPRSPWTLNRTGGCCRASAASGWKCCGWMPSSSTTTPTRSIIASA
ncbi:MAG: FMN-binding negative transcriptional regulator [Actinomycetota bacterium]